ncbi:MAG: hypothetical protein WDW36_009327 [Sanguina aurantia]
MRGQDQRSAPSCDDDYISSEDLTRWTPEKGPSTPLLDTVNFPVHIKNFNSEQLKQLAKEVRSDIVHKVSKTGGHLSSSLGVVELTVALHYVFNTPEDKIIWDVGHQAYGHKILTGRRKQMSTIRQTDGLSGFTKRDESEYDPFGAGHSSTSISAGLGMAVGRDFKGKKNSVIAVIGDGAITGGMAYEAMNHAGFLDSNMIVVLNDNQQVSLPTQYNGKNQQPVGALASALARLQASRPLRELREVAKGVTKQLPDVVQRATAKIDEYARGMISGTGSTLFEELGLYYIGPLDGHNLDDIIAVLNEVRSAETVGPVLVHLVTEKGRGYLPAETAQDKMHGVGKFDPQTGTQVAVKAKCGSFTNFFADALSAEAEKDSRVVAIHAAMAGGTGLSRFEKRFPDRVFDVGIAEQHAVTFAAGLACEGLIVHDVALQRLPVRFAMDRAGLVGADGSTHCGAFDVTFMASLPSMVCMAPSNEAELVNMDFKGTPLEVGKGVVRRSGTDVALLAYGSSVNEALAAAEMLAASGVQATVVDARFCKPLDTALIRRLAKEHPVLISIEEGSIGGFASHVMQFLALDGLLDNGLKFRPMTLPDRFIDHGDYRDQLAAAGLDASQIASTALITLGRPQDAAKTTLSFIR